MEFYHFLFLYFSFIFFLAAPVDSHSPAQQDLQAAPPIPVIQLSQDYILNRTLSVVQPNTSYALQARRGHSQVPGSTSRIFNPLFRRDAGPCTADSPCPDGRFVTQMHSTLNAYD